MLQLSLPLAPICCYLQLQAAVKRTGYVMAVWVIPYHHPIILALLQGRIRRKQPPALESEVSDRRLPTSKLPHPRHDTGRHKLSLGQP